MDYREQFLVRPDRKLRLNRRDPGYTGEFGNAQAAAPETQRYHDKLGDLQKILWAQRKHSVLIVLQALDAGGKDGTISHVFSALNPQGVSVASFKVPTAIELEHDFLWRVHPHTPGKGQIAIFNRSHYEDVLVTRVHGLIDKPTWKERYKLIRAFERTLCASGTTVLKFYLHISRDEQLERLERRLEDPSRTWKITMADIAERALWDAYIDAYEDALSRTSMGEAPWYVIPSNHKWFRNLAVSQIVTDTMDELHMTFPPPSVDLAEVRRALQRELELEKQRR
jgi:PPK2 family polyphosphate:nucleotide phosphotransferase